MKFYNNKVAKTFKKHKKKILKIGMPIILGLIIFTLGFLVSDFINSKSFPKNIVWPAEKAIKIPKDLRSTLESLDDCKGYRGTNTPRGVGLWGVFQVENSSFAKISYGCSTSLSSYIVAVKNNTGWILLQPVKYFSDKAHAIPNCEILTEYKIPNSFESFCVNINGEVVNNPNKK